MLSKVLTTNKEGKHYSKKPKGGKETEPKILMRGGNYLNHTVSGDPSNFTGKSLQTS